MIMLQLSALSAVRIVDISVGYDHCAAVSNTGDVYVWGRWFEMMLMIMLPIVLDVIRATLKILLLS